MKSEPKLNELFNNLEKQIAVLENSDIEFEELVATYQEAAITLEKCYKILGDANKTIMDIDERIEALKTEQGEI